MGKARLFSTEAELVAAFCTCIDPARWAKDPAYAPKWVAYHETAGWDLLLAHPETGEQIGIEAKLSLNAKVLEQALPGRWASGDGPDYRAVLVPADAIQHHMAALARHLGIVVVAVSADERGRYNTGFDCRFDYRPALPRGDSLTYDQWPQWCPAKRCTLPDYVPDVMGGHAAPVKLSEWKIKAIKLLILLERNGAVTRRQMKALQISPTRWTDHFHGFLSPGPDGYVRNARTPDLKAQHPTNWAQIEADFDKWSVGVATAARLGLEAA